MTINFDMDGTLVDLYGVANWLDYLMAESTYPYEMAEPLLNFSYLARLLNKARANGVEINIISWTCRNGSDEYNERVALAKMRYLAKRLPSVTFDNIYIVPYGTRKSSLAGGILFDDEKPNRDDWGAMAYKPEDIIKILKDLAQ